MALGQPPLDLFLLGSSVKAYLRSRSKYQLGWKGKATGPKGAKGHNQILEELVKECSIPIHNLDKIDKSREWTQHYKTLIEPNCHDIHQGEGYIRTVASTTAYPDMGQYS